MAQILLYAHSYGRWFLLLFAVIVIVRSLNGWLNKKPFVKADNTFSIILIIFTHTQLVVGLLLYFVYSPLMQTGFDIGIGGMMKDANIRKIAVEHLSLMLIAVVLIQMGRTTSKKATTDLTKHKKLAIYTLIAFILMGAGIPNWEFLGM